MITLLFVLIAAKAVFVENTFVISVVPFRSFDTLVEFPPLLALPQVISDPSDVIAANADPVADI